MEEQKSEAVEVMEIENIVRKMPSLHGSIVAI